MRPRLHSLGFLIAALSVACGPTLISHANRGGDRAARPAGCEIEVHDTDMPTRRTGSLGEVRMRCHGEHARDVQGCRRGLMDQACAMGATVIWQVESSEIEDGVQLRAVAGVYR